MLDGRFWGLNLWPKHEIANYCCHLANTIRELVGSRTIFAFLLHKTAYMLRREIKKNVLSVAAGKKLATGALEILFYCIMMCHVILSNNS